MSRPGPDAAGSTPGASGPGPNPGGAPTVGPLAVEAALLLDVVADRLAALKPDPTDRTDRTDRTEPTAPTGAGPVSTPPGPVPGGDPAGGPGPEYASAGRPPGPDGRCPECGSVPGASCTACPLCRFLAMLRGERPETTAKLVDGALLIVRALRSMIPEVPTPADATGPAAPRAAGDPPPPPPPARRGGFERIDIL